MTTECAYCQQTRNLPPGMTLCVDPCLDRLETALRDIPDLADQLLTTLARQDVLQRPGQDGGNTHAGPAEPVNGAARDPGEDLTATLRSWADQLDHDHGTTTAKSYSRRIIAHLNTIRSRPDAGQLVDEILDAYHRARRVVDLPPEKILLGACNATHEGQDCPGEVRGIRGRHEARCDTCGETYSQAQRQQQAVANAWEHRRPLATIVKALRQAGFKISASSAKRWATAGDLRTPWAATDGTALYTMAQVYEVMQAKRSNHGGKRRRTVRAA